PAVVFFDRDPEARQKLLDITGVSTPYVRLSLVDIFDRTNAPSLLAPSVATLNAATGAGSLVNGLSYAYFESATSYYWESSGVNWSSMPNFAVLSPVRQGAVNHPDLTPRRRRCGYAFNYVGFFEAPTDGLYTFTVNSSDGAKLIIDGALIVNWDGIHSPVPLSGWTGLRAGKHAVNIQYFCNTQNSNAGDLTDNLTLFYEGPGIGRTEVPDRAWFRVPAANEPNVALAAPADGAVLCGSNVTFSAEVVPNGATVSNVQFYVGDNFWGQAAGPSYSSSSFVWAAPRNLVRARLFYNGGTTLDSAQNLVSATNMSLAPWSLSVIGDHVYPVGGKIAGGVYSMLGDGLNLLTRQVTADCTLVAHVAGLIQSGAGPDGQVPDSDWQAGIIFRGSTNATPGTPLGDSRTRYASVFCTVGSDTHFQDDTMANAGGPYWSSGLGGQRWFKIKRVGNTFTTSVSSDGSSWTAVNTNNLSGIGTTVFVGLFTYAASSQNPNVFRASFDHVSLIGNSVGPPSVSVAPETETAYPGQTSTFTALPSGSP
ncbi:MAG TPA: PA14 domain-containing protein, partial [Verrucomicrobiae bacterium]|nr:PA14 domain-containing protein [Verrucomicrobiae bacterium]